MKKQLKTIVCLLVMVGLLAGCKKYENGPAFSLHSKKSRLANTWTIEKSIVGANVTMGTDPAITNYKFSLTKDGKMTTSYNDADFGGTYTATGTWALLDKSKTLQLTYSYAIQSPMWGGSTGNETSKWTILKLKEDELWLKSLDYPDMQINYKPL